MQGQSFGCAFVRSLERARALPGDGRPGAPTYTMVSGRKAWSEFVTVQKSAMGSRLLSRTENCLCECVGHGEERELLLRKQFGDWQMGMQHDRERWIGMGDEASRENDYKPNVEEHGITERTRSLLGQYPISNHSNVTEGQIVMSRSDSLNRTANLSSRLWNKLKSESLA
jgi:hypothetical protein